MKTEELPFNTDTYEPLMEYPAWDVIRDEVKNEIISGIIKIPEEHIFDSKKYIEDTANKRRVELIGQYREIESQARQYFFKQMEERHDISSWKSSVKNEIHRIAWDRGHSGGYSDIEAEYYDLVELCKTVRMENL